MKPLIKFGHKDQKYRCPYCRKRSLSFNGIGIHMARKHSYGKMYSFKLSDKPSIKGNYPFRIVGLCACGCGEPIEYPVNGSYMPWAPDHAPPYFISGHKSRVLPLNKGNFKKGNVPWNKGTEGICKPNSGSFKKGNVPKNERGGLYTAPNGQVLEWTGEYQPSGPRKYRARSRRIMEEKLGRKLRDDEVVIHLNGDSSNDDPRNLKVITRAENATRNRWKGHKAKPKKTKPKVAVSEKKAKAPPIVVEDIEEDIIVPVEVGPGFCSICGTLMQPGAPCPRC
jgi:hypothetical protein